VICGMLARRSARGMSSQRQLEGSGTLNGDRLAREFL
jgi:hypothetical protein